MNAVSEPTIERSATNPIRPISGGLALYPFVSGDPGASYDEVDSDIIYQQEVTDGTNTARLTVAICEDGTYGTLQIENNEGPLKAMVLNLTSSLCDALANMMMDGANLLDEAEKAGRLA